MLLDIIEPQQPQFEQKRVNNPAHPRARTGKWVSVLGWVITAGGGISLVVGLSDLDNLTILAIGGVIFILIGLLLITNGQILSGLARLEKNTPASKEAQPPGDSASL